MTEAGLPGNRSLPEYVRLTTQAIPAFPHRSAVLYLRREIPHVQLDTSQLCTTLAEFVRVRMSIGNQTFAILLGYVRPNGTDLPSEEILACCKDRTEELLICDDFNAHNVAWGSARTDKRGDALMTVIVQLRLAVANDGRPTFFRPPNSYSVLDVTAHSPSLEMNWELAPDTRGSDHFSIHITIKGCRGEESLAYVHKLGCFSSSARLEPRRNSSSYNSSVTDGHTHYFRQRMAPKAGPHIFKP